MINLLSLGLTRPVFGMKGNMSSPKEEPKPAPASPGTPSSILPHPLSVMPTPIQSRTPMPLMNAPEIACMS